MGFETDNLQSSASNCIRVSGHTPMHCWPFCVSKKRMSKQENQQSPLKQLTNNPHQSHQSAPPREWNFSPKKTSATNSASAEKSIGGAWAAHQQHHDFAGGILNLLGTPGLLTSADHGSRSCPSLHLLCPTTSAVAFYCGCKNQHFKVSPKL